MPTGAARPGRTIRHGEKVEAGWRSTAQGEMRTPLEGGGSRKGGIARAGVVVKDAGELNNVEVGRGWAGFQPVVPRRGDGRGEVGNLVAVVVILDGDVLLRVDGERNEERTRRERSLAKRSPRQHDEQGTGQADHYTPPGGRALAMGGGQDRRSN